jgi:hypothetical protein
MAASTILRVVLGCGLVVVFSLLPTTAPAESLMIQYTGLNISYDGTSIVTVGGVDPLYSVDFLVDGVKVLALDAPGDSPLALELSIPGVPNMPDTGGTVTSATGGSLSLALPDGDFVDLQLGQAQVTYLAVNYLYMYFALAAGEAELLGQLLPVDGFAGDVAVSLSSQIVPASLTIVDHKVTGFVSAGTGEIEGPQVPEPTVAALLLGGLVVCLAGIRRRG